MKNLIVVDTPTDWPLNVSGADVVEAKSYLTSEQYRKDRNVRIFNICRSYKYQSMGYYVSLLAAARGHKPVPSVATIQDMKSQSIVRLASDELDDLIQRSLSDIKSEEFTLSIYFGKNVSKKYDRLSAHLYRLFNAPCVRAHFSREEDKWILRKVGPISAKEIPPAHRELVLSFANDYFSGKRHQLTKRPESRFNLAILYDAVAPTSPSNEKALKNFIKAAERLQIETEIITHDDYARLPEFDALFIRETTAVNHHTFRFARRAEAEGLVVIDDPESILKCTNKVYLNEVLEKNRVPTPRTLVVHRDNLHMITESVGLPCILKQPDSSFSQGVIKVEDEDGLFRESEKMLETSDLIVAQEFLPTTFDWRVGVLDNSPLFVSKYFMARKHWQIAKRDENGNNVFGKDETIPVELAPRKLISLALQCSKLIGKGLYGLDIKQIDNKFYVIEINDNPNIDANSEDTILKDQLYLRIMQVFLKRMIQKKEGHLYI